MPKVNEASRVVQAWEVGSSGKGLKNAFTGIGSGISLTVMLMTGCFVACLTEQSQDRTPKHLSTDYDPLFEYYQWLNKNADGKIEFPYDFVHVGFTMTSVSPLRKVPRRTFRPSGVGGKIALNQRVSN
jgi:hypothetical protein